MNATTTMSIGAASRAMGLSEDTLRYYERIGLLPRIERELNGRRRYSEDHLRLLQFVVRMRSTGMPLETLKRYVQLTRKDPIGTREERRQLLQDQAQAVSTQILELQRTLEILQHKLDRIDCLPQATP